MKTSIKIGGALAAVVVTTFMASFPLDSRSEYRCDNPASVGERTACEKAQEGPKALRWYIERTRAIYGLYFWDYVRPTEPTNTTQQAQAPARIDAEVDSKEKTK